MSKHDQTVWHVTGYTYHTNPNCYFIRGKNAMTFSRGYAERSGFRLCIRCEKWEPRNPEVRA